MDQNQASHKSGFVAVIGRPNVGKSTLVNTLLHQKIAAVSPRPQMTRRRQLGILTTDEYQIIFIDTPGIHKPVHKLGETMNQLALEALSDADLILWLVDLSAPPTPEDEQVASRLKAIKNPPPVLLLLNKVDLSGPERAVAAQPAFETLYPPSAVFKIVAASGQGCEKLLAEVVQRLPEGPRYYEEDEITDLYEREIAMDLIREAVMLHLRDEVPHATAVRIDEYKDRGEDAAYIAATLLVERDTQKGIVIGKGAEMLKRIGSTARVEIEKMSGRKVFLELRVKVNKNWRDDPSILRSLGYVVRKE